MKTNYKIMRSIRRRQETLMFAKNLLDKVNDVFLNIDPKEGYNGQKRRSKAENNRKVKV